MNILILTQYYPPEPGAPQNRLSDLAMRLHRRGHRVTVLTALPNYPRQEIFPEYRGRLTMEETVDGIRIIRTWIYCSKKPTFFRRLLNYWSFALSSLLLGWRRTGRQDAILVELPPLFLGISGIVLALMKRAKCIINVSDLWPQSAIDMDVIRNQTVIALSTWLEEFIYRRADLLTGQTSGIVANIRRRFPSKQVELFTNGVDVDQFVTRSEHSKRADVRDEFEWGNRFVVAYLGLHGLAQGLECAIEAAEFLANESDILFVFFGDGPTKDELMQRVEERRIPNVRFYPTRSREKVRQILGAVDAALVPLRRLALFKGALPSKLFEAMASGIPVILSVDGEARELVERANAGIYVEPEDGRGIADAVLRLYRSPELRNELGTSGRAYVIRYFDRQKIALDFERLLLST